MFLPLSSTSIVILPPIFSTVFLSLLFWIELSVCLSFGCPSNTQAIDGLKKIETWKEKAKWLQCPLSLSGSSSTRPNTRHQERAAVRCRLMWCRAMWCLAAVRPRALKALVWFWLIDEILSAKLVYQSVHEIGSTFQVAKQMKIITWWQWCHGDDQALGLEKKKEKNKRLKARYKW